MGGWGYGGKGIIGFFLMDLVSLNKCAGDGDGGRGYGGTEGGINQNPHSKINKNNSKPTNTFTSYSKFKATENNPPH
jgi:hypothetical protein